MSAAKEVGSLDIRVDLLLFEVGVRLLAVDATQVLRIDRPTEEALELPALGRLDCGDRALVFRAGEGEGQLKIDRVKGLRRVSVDHLRRMPEIVRASRCAMGFWLDGEQPVMLVDLSEHSFSQTSSDGGAQSHGTGTER